jgi:predicted metalloprotease
MTFNDNARSSGPRASRRGRGAAIAGGGGVVGIIVVFLIAQFTGIDVSGLLGGSPQQGQEVAIEGCETGADANEDTTCRADFAAQSIEDYWEGELGEAYVPPGYVLFEASVDTGCGGATSAVGPFYCPSDQTVYLDVSFYDELRSRFGAEGGPLAEMYVVAHEWGHHIQNITGTMGQAERGDTGPTSDSVRLELQADCYAGAWAGAAATTEDEYGTTLLEPLTEEQVAQALDAASVIGDDHIQETLGGEVEPHTWSHGSSEQRQRWFVAGYEGGASNCDTFAVSGERL